MWICEFGIDYPSYVERTWFFFLGMLHDDLRIFLQENVPTGSKKNKVVLGIADSKIAGSISEELDITCQHTGVVPEVIRGTRMLTCSSFKHKICWCASQFVFVIIGFVEYSER